MEPVQRFPIQVAEQGIAAHLGYVGRQHRLLALLMCNRHLSNRGPSAFPDAGTTVFGEREYT